VSVSQYSTHQMNHLPVCRLPVVEFPQMNTRAIKALESKSDSMVRLSCNQMDKHTDICLGF